MKMKKLSLKQLSLSAASLELHRQKIAKKSIFEKESVGIYEDAFESELELQSPAVCKKNPYHQVV